MGRVFAFLHSLSIKENLIEFAKRKLTRVAFALGLTLILILQTTPRVANAISFPPPVPPIGSGVWAAEFFVVNGMEYLGLMQGGGTATTTGAFEIIPLGPASTPALQASGVQAATSAEAQVAAQGIRIFGVKPSPLLLRVAIIVGTAVIVTLVADKTMNGNWIWQQKNIGSVLMRKSGNWGPNPGYATVSCQTLNQGSFYAMTACRQAFHTTVVKDNFWSDITCRDIWNPASPNFNNPLYVETCEAYVVACVAKTAKVCADVGQLNVGAFTQGNSQSISTEINVAWNTGHWTSDDTPASMAGCIDSDQHSTNALQCCSGAVDDYDEVCL